MIFAINISLSGLSAQKGVVSAVASNIANISTIGRAPTAQNPETNAYRPVEYTLSSTENGGVSGKLEDIDPPFQYTYNGTFAPDGEDSGLIARPNIELDQQLVTMKVAEVSYKANLAAIKTADEMAEELIDTLA
jgi:flagellar basal-body rod protein FlgC